jgi:hypothetical protein
MLVADTRIDNLLDRVLRLVGRALMGRGLLASWFPFTPTELQVALGVLAFVTTSLLLFDAPERAVGWGSLGAVGFLYLAGLLVHSRSSRFRFIRDGSLSGEGYLDYFRRARKSLLLLHIDDDSPGPELLGLYRKLLDRGVEIRRVIFVRPSHRADAYRWVVDFGSHKRLLQRVILPEQAEVMRMGFVVVDGRFAILALPGGAAVDSEGYATAFVLRDLLVVEDPGAATALTEVHSQLWRRAVPLQDAELLLSPHALAANLRTRTAAPT